VRGQVPQEKGAPHKGGAASNQTARYGGNRSRKASTEAGTGQRHYMSNKRRGPEAQSTRAAETNSTSELQLTGTNTSKRTSHNHWERSRHNEQGRTKTIDQKGQAAGGPRATQTQTRLQRHAGDQQKPTREKT